MTKLLEQAIEEVRKLPESEQDELAVRLLTSLPGEIVLDAETRAAVRRGLEEMRQGKLASDEEVAAVFDRYR